MTQEKEISNWGKQKDLNYFNFLPTCGHVFACQFTTAVNQNRTFHHKKKKSTFPLGIASCRVLTSPGDAEISFINIFPSFFPTFLS